MAIRIRSEADSERASGRNRAGIGEGRRVRNGVRGDCRRNSQRFHINPASVRLLFQPCVGDNNASGKDIRHQSKSGNFVHAERTSGGQESDIRTRFYGIVCECTAQKCRKNKQHSENTAKHMHHLFSYLSNDCAQERSYLFLRRSAGKQQKFVVALP